MLFVRTFVIGCACHLADVQCRLAFCLRLDSCCAYPNKDSPVSHQACRPDRDSIPFQEAVDQRRLPKQDLPLFSCIVFHVLVGINPHTCIHEDSLVLSVLLVPEELYNHFPETLLSKHALGCQHNTLDILRALSRYLSHFLWNPLS